MSLNGKVVLVTGGSRGIGAAICSQLGDAGATVVGTATTAAGADQISERFSASGIAGAGRVLDVRDEAMVAELVKEITASYGGLSILVNNAGITRDQILLRMKGEDWDEIMATNLRSVYLLSKAAMRPMMKARWGRIISIASVVGLMGNPGQANYAAAKAGIIGFSKSIAKEVGARGITVNVVAPGFVETDMTKALDDAQRAVLMSQIPLQRLGGPEDIAQAVLFLASDGAAYITGETLNVNGGMLMH